MLVFLQSFCKGFCTAREQTKNDFLQRAMQCMFLALPASYGCGANTVAVTCMLTMCTKRGYEELPSSCAYGSCDARACYACGTMQLNAEVIHKCAGEHLQSCVS